MIIFDFEHFSSPIKISAKSEIFDYIFYFNPVNNEEKNET